MTKKTAIDLLHDQVTADRQAGNSTQFYFGIPGYPAFGFTVDLDNLLDQLADPDNSIHKAVGIVGSNLLPCKNDQRPGGHGFSIPLYDMDQLSNMLRKRDNMTA